jgi:hypothetical protein
MPISVTIPRSSPPSAPDLIHTWSPTSTGRASRRTIPANRFERLCCAAMPTSTVANAPPTSTCVTPMPNSSRVIKMAARPPNSTMA